jgi:hypothetical protein
MYSYRTLRSPNSCGAGLEYSEEAIVREVARGPSPFRATYLRRHHRVAVIGFSGTSTSTGSGSLNTSSVPQPRPFR